MSEYAAIKAELLLTPKEAELLLTPKVNGERPLPRRVKELRAFLRHRKPGSKQARRPSPEARKQHADIPDSPSSPTPSEPIDLTRSDDESDEEMEGDVHPIEIGKK